MGAFVLKLLMGIIALALAIAFFAVPVVKLKDPALTLVILIGIAAMVYNFIEVLREKDED